MLDGIPISLRNLDIVHRISLLAASVPNKIGSLSLKFWVVFDNCRSDDRAISGVGLRPLACWDLGFEYRPWAWRFVCCECYVLPDRGLGDELLTRLEKSYHCGASLCVIKKPQEWGGHVPCWDAAPSAKKIDNFPRPINSIFVIWGLRSCKSVEFLPETLPCTKHLALYDWIPPIKVSVCFFL